MLRSIASRYAFASSVAPDEHVDIAVIRRDSDDWRYPLTSYAFSLLIDPSSLVDPSIFNRGPTAISLEATFDPRSLEICIANIEGRALERGQSFARKTYSHLLELTPECTSLVLYNITNSRATAVVDKARTSPDWVIPPDGALLRSLYECGFQRVVGIERGGPAYRCVHATRQNSA